MTKPIAVYTDADDTDITPGIRLLEEAGFEVRVLGTRDAAQIIAGARDATALLPGYAPITAEVIQGLPGLRIIPLMSMGFDYVDVAAATERGVWVTNLPGIATEEVATHALTILLYLLRNLRFYLASATPERWNERDTRIPPRLSEQTLGIVGLGRIGREFARVARPLFGRMIGYDPLLPNTEQTERMLVEVGVERVSLAQVQQQAGVLSLHVPLSEATAGMVNAEFLAQLRPGAVLVNVSRGALIDERALVAALDRGHLAGAALDVLATEPPGRSHPLLGRPDVVLTPHVAYLSERTEAEYVRIQARNAISLMTTGVPDTPVNQPTHRGDGN